MILICDGCTQDSEQKTKLKCKVNCRYCQTIGVVRLNFNMPFKMVWPVKTGFESGMKSCSQLLSNTGRWLECMLSFLYELLCYCTPYQRLNLCFEMFTIKVNEQRCKNICIQYAAIAVGVINFMIVEWCLECAVSGRTFISYNSPKPFECWLLVQVFLLVMK